MLIFGTYNVYGIGKMVELTSFQRAPLVINKADQALPATPEKIIADLKDELIVDSLRRNVKHILVSLNQSVYSRIDLSRFYEKLELLANSVFLLYPDAHLTFLGELPMTRDRWFELAPKKMRSLRLKRLSRFNAVLKSYADSSTRTSYLDTDVLFRGSDEWPDPELYVSSRSIVPSEIGLKRIAESYSTLLVDNHGRY